MNSKLAVLLFGVAAVASRLAHEDCVDESSCSAQVQEVRKPENKLPVKVKKAANATKLYTSAQPAFQTQPCNNGVMSFRLANTTRNNLGNQGPEQGTTGLEEGMFISNVFPDSGRDISLVINAMTPYTPHKVDKNGLWKKGEFNQINIRCGTETDFRFTFVDSETLEQVQMPDFFMTFYDLDEMKNGLGREYLKFANNFKSATLSKTTVVEREDAAGQTTFRSTEFGNRGDNPTHPRVLTQAQEDKAVEVMFPSGSEFTVTFGAADVPGEEKGRNVLFSGASTLDCPKVAMCNTAQCPSGYNAKPGSAYITCKGQPCNMDEAADRDKCCDYLGLCSDDARMVFKVSTVSRNNLGNQGPNFKDPEGIMYDNVFPQSGKKINLLLKAESDYQLVDKYNGLNKQKSLAVINVRTETSVDISFNFIDEYGNAAEVGPFYLAFLDFDEGREDGMAREYVTVRGHTGYTLTDETLVSVVHQDDGAVTFRSTVYGRGKDNAKDAMELTEEQMQKSVAVAFPRLSTFHATIGVGDLPNGWNGYGRNINFAGFTNMVCNDEIAMKHFNAGTTRSNRVEEADSYS
jgi:hypothetical protein